MRKDIKNKVKKKQGRTEKRPPGKKRGGRDPLPSAPIVPHGGPAAVPAETGLRYFTSSNSTSSGCP